LQADELISSPAQMEDGYRRAGLIFSLRYSSYGTPVGRRSTWPYDASRIACRRSISRKAATGIVLRRAIIAHPMRSPGAHTLYRQEFL